MYDPILLKQIAALAQRYNDEILSEWGRGRDLQKNWFKAFNFFLAYVYYQGRSDTLSDRYYENAIKALRRHFGAGAGSQGRLREAWKAKWIPHDPDWHVYAGARNPIWKALTVANAGKHRDREMVVDILRYVHGLVNHNVVTHSLREIRAGRILTHQADLQSIWQIGPKTSSFYLRDLCSLYGVELEADGAEAVQPIDTWVWQICEAVGIAADSDDLPSVRRKLLAACDSAGVSASAFNTGAWYLGTHSLEIAIEFLKKPTPEAAG